MGESIGFFLSTLTINIDVVISVGTVVALLFLILGGFYAKSLPFWLGWLKYFSALRYTYIACLKIVLQDYDYIECNNDGYFISECVGNDEISHRTVMKWLGTGVLGSYYAPYNIFIMIAIFLFFRLLTFLSLVYLPIKIGRD